MQTLQNHAAPLSEFSLAPDLLCDKAEAGLAVPGVLLYEPKLGACSVNEHWGDILSTGTCGIERDGSLYSYLFTVLAEPLMQSLHQAADSTEQYALFVVEDSGR